MSRNLISFDVSAGSKIYPFNNQNATQLTGAELKRKINEKLDNQSISVDYLMFEGNQVIEDDKTLSEYMIQTGDVITAHLKTFGGETKKF